MQRETFYARLIREDVAALGHVGQYNPADVEAWMRVEHGTLDGLSRARFRAEVQVAIACINAASPADTASLRASFGL
jgi:predicted methyltransferase